MAAHRQLDAAVLRQPALGDVEPRHDLDARDDGRLQARRRRLDFMQCAVIAVAHAQPVGKRLQVDVGRMSLDGARDQLIDQPDHRRFARQIFEALGVLLGGLALGNRLVQHRALIGPVGLCIEPIEGRIEFHRNGNRDSDPPAERRRNRIAREDIERVGHREGHAILAFTDRHCASPAQELRLQPLGEKRRFRIVGGHH